ncbi:MAG: hypothetical protein WCS85_02320 [Candidatus Peribacteraceae bacterium]
MIPLAFLIGIALPTVCGWLLLRLLEGKTPVLLRMERWALGFLAGLMLTMSATFLGAVAGLPLSLPLFLGVQIVLVLALIAGCKLSFGIWFPSAPPSSLPPSGRVPRWAAVLLMLLGVWTAAKICVGGVLLVSTPPRFDDTVKNWNLRGKIFFTTHALDTSVAPEEQDILGGLRSYPPGVSLAKTWLSLLAGQWNEGLANSIHIVWFFTVLLLLYSLLRRCVTTPWALFGVYLLTSLPLFMIHGVSAYADVFLSAHVLAAVGLLFLAVREEDAARRRTFLRLDALMLALLPLTKNEGLVLYLPILLMLLMGCLFFLQRRQRLSTRELCLNILGFAGTIAVLALPWLAYKWLNGFTFGNAKALTGLAVSWNPLALQAIAVMLFFEGSWLLMVPLLALLLLFGRRIAFTQPLLVLTFFLCGAFLVQILLFTVTALANEALYQTGFGRGLIHLMPVAVLLLTILAHWLLSPEKE